MKVLNAVLRSLAVIGIFGSHVRADHLCGVSAMTTTTDHDPSHCGLSTNALHCPTSDSLFFDNFEHSNDGWSSNKPTNDEQADKPA